MISTGAGELQGRNGVRHIIHVAAVHGEPGEGYQPAAVALNPSPECAPSNGGCPAPSAHEFDPAGLPSHGPAGERDADVWFLARLPAGQNLRTHPARASRALAARPGAAVRAYVVARLSQENALRSLDGTGRTGRGDE